MSAQAQAAVTVTPQPLVAAMLNSVAASILTFATTSEATSAFDSDSVATLTLITEDAPKVFSAESESMMTIVGAAIGTGAFNINSVSLLQGIGAAVGASNLDIDSATVLTGVGTVVSVALSKLTFNGTITTDDVGTLTWSAGSGATKETTLVKHGAGALKISGNVQRFLSITNGFAFWDPPGPAAFCIGSYFKGSADNSSSSITLSNGSGNTRLDIIVQWDEPGNKFDFTWTAYNESSGVIFERTDSVSGYDTDYHFLAMTFDGATYRLYWDTDLIDSFASTVKTSASATQGFQISGNTPDFGGASYFDTFGVFDAARFTGATCTPWDGNYA